MTQSAFKSIVGELVGRLAVAGRVDAVFLDLHGAMVCEHVADGDGEIIRRVRKALGPEVTIVVVLDFHANITRLMVETADLLVTYRTYPHVDMEETGRRAAALLVDASSRPYKAFRKLPYLIPLHWQSTLAEPMASMMAIVKDAERAPSITSAALAAGFSLADFDECGPAVVVYGNDREAVDASADRSSGRSSNGSPPSRENCWNRRKPSNARGPCAARCSLPTPRTILALARPSTPWAFFAP